MTTGTFVSVTYAGFAAIGAVWVLYYMARFALGRLRWLLWSVRLWWGGLYSVQVARRMERYC